MGSSPREIRLKESCRQLHLCPETVSLSLPACSPFDTLAIVHALTIGRSGKTTIWPYVMRELPISPLRALHLELQSKGWQGKLADTCSTATAVERVKGVEYFPARLTPEDLDSERVYENECTREPLAGFDLDMPRTTFEGGSRCEESLSDEVRGKVTVPPDRSLTIISGTMKEDQRPKTSRPRRRPPADLLARATSSELHRRSDFTECRVGCGKEIRVQDLDDHENSLCHLRYEFFLRRRVQDAVCGPCNACSSIWNLLSW